MTDKLICQQCPNGCNLSVEWKDEIHAVIAGNKCARGVGFAARILRQERQGRNIHVASMEKTPNFSAAALKEIVARWGLVLSQVRHDIAVQGSPERSAFRAVIEDDAKNLFVVEQLFLKTLTAKQNIAKTLELLAQRKLDLVRPYKLGLKGEAIVKYKSSFWQMADFVPGVDLDRATYMFDKWRGPLLARFLIGLRERSKDLPFFNAKKTFSLKDYVYRLAGHVKTYKPSLKEEIAPVMDFLEKEWMPFYDKIPISFCHGDYHPMNMIWSEHNINAVIDWEFCGYKSEIYDMANLIGCVGVEDPRALEGELVCSFIEEMKKANIISDASWKYLLEFIVALRFAWLSEWLRRKDDEMITLEMDYMLLLMENKAALLKAWGL